MRKVFYILMALVTFYLAGMYRYQALMLVFVMEIAFGVLSFALSRYFRSSLSIEFVRHNDIAEKGMPITCCFKVFNKGMLPINNFCFRFCSGYLQRDTSDAWISGAGDIGEDIQEVELVFKYCGMMNLNMNKLKVYDYLSLFGASKKLEEKMEIAVFPQEKALYIEMFAFGHQRNNMQSGQTAGRGQDAHNEIRQLREYRAGDNNRYIHWNQSARMDELLVKEYEKESDHPLELLLDMENLAQTALSGQDAFYELLWALVMGFLKIERTVVRVHWYDGRSTGLACEEVADANQCRSMLEQLYRLNPDVFDSEKKAEQERRFMLEGSAFKLDSGLCWYWDEMLIYQFSQDKLEGEIAGKIFKL